MNLHIVPDNVFINKVCENLRECGVAANNRLVIRTSGRKLKYVRQDLPFAPLYSAAFDRMTGDTAEYEKVFVHFFSPLLYRWVATRSFQELNWMVWGADLYNLPSVRAPLYEDLTLKRYVRGTFSMNDFLYRAKVAVLHERFRDRAYAKVDNVLTWMTREYEFAIANLPALKAGHQFFFYENDMHYEALDEMMNSTPAPADRERPLYILGNSSSAELNHLDAIAAMNAAGAEADLLLPVSYGNAKYARFLKKNLPVYKGGELRFIDRYMGFKDYLQFLYNADGLVMNNIRPQGYGNIFMMMYLGKRIFLNEKNLSIPDLDKAGLLWQPVARTRGDDRLNWSQNKAAVSRLLSHDLLLQRYRELFG
ncbi:MAG TPA: TDP-N-acetylfucosamine:lipid II N-acetylfucosaminyltransferase [Chryseosolibacter sp.]